MSRHLPVGYDHIDIEFDNFFQSVGAIHGGHDFKTLQNQGETQHFADSVLIVDDTDAFWHEGLHPKRTTYCRVSNNYANNVRTDKIPQNA